MNEIIVDCFAGGGGVSTGIEMALGRSPDIAINHDAVALAMHKANHPSTHHLNSNIFKVIPSEACGGRPIGMLWLSPDCKHFSRAKGAKPVEKRIRGLAWVALHWAQLPAWQRPRVIFLENVPEFLTWGPLLANGRPDPERRGEEFAKFVRALKRQGYSKIDWRIRRMCNWGDPTIRQRLQLIARCDDEPIVWPDETHGDPKSEAVVARTLPPWRTAATDVIDWSIPCPSIFLSKSEVKRLYLEQGVRVQRPLKPKTMARIFKGMVRFVLECADPFIIPVTHAGDLRSHGVGEPMRTQTGAKRGEHAVVTPYLVPRYGEREGQQPRSQSTEAPLSVVVPTGNGASLVTPYLAPRYQEKPGHKPRTRGVEQPMATMVPGGNEGVLVTPFITKFRENSIGHPVNEPLHTVTANSFVKRPGGASPLGVVAAHLSRQFGNSVGSECAAPVGTVTAGGDGKTALVSAFLAKHYGDTGQRPGSEMTEPVATITSQDHHAVVSAGLLNLKGTKRRGGPITAPTPALTGQGGHLAEVRAFLIKFYGTGGQNQDARDPLHTVTAKARFGIVTVHGEDYQIVDIGMRMLTARERFNAHSFPPSYKIDILVPRTKRGITVMKPITGEEQGRMVGNSVPCRFVAAHVGANYRPRLASDRKPPRSSEEFTLEAAE